jgi:hypothetical protein
MELKAGFVASCLFAEITPEQQRWVIGLVRQFN